MTPVIRVCQKCGTEIPANAPEGGCPGCFLQTALDAAGGQVVFGRYKLIKVLGRGGMGIVWLARDEELERNVALKFLPDLMIQDRALLDQLKRETKRCLELTHPHIVRIHDFVHDERSGCISMEYVDGETLSNLRAEKEQKVFDPDEIADWVTQLCEALDYAHNRAKVIHRDLKPANLMVNKRGDLKVADFGIARSLVDSASRLTAEQGRSGTLVYMSPQQLSGGRGTHLDDIYSLGVTIYELLTSKPPFYSGNIDRQICERVAPSMTDRRKELDIEPAFISPVWEDTVAACLAKDPLQRPQSATEVPQRLQFPSGPARIRTTPGKPLKRKPLLVAGIAAMVVVLLAGVYFGAFKRQAKPVLHAPVIPEKSIAVLPFENLSKDEENAFFAGGVQDEILSDLAKIADLKVISRTSVMKYKSGPERNLREIASALGVSHVVEGSVQHAGGRIRVSAQLIDARTDSHLWAEHYDRDFADVFAIQSEIAQQIADQLRSKLSPVEKARLQLRPTQSGEAYLVYLQAQDVSNRSQTNALREAMQLYQKAIELDPSFALAFARLSFVASTDYLNTGDPGSLEKARVAANESLRLQPDLPEAHFALGHLYYRGERDYDRALQELAIAKKGLPNDADIFLVIGSIERRRGNWNQSTAELEKAVSLNPKDGSLWANLAANYRAVNNFPAAEQALDRGIALDPDFFMNRYLRAFLDIDSKGDIGAMERLLSQTPQVVDRDGKVTLARFQLKLFQRKYKEALDALTHSAFESLSAWMQPTPIPKALLVATAYRLLGEDPEARGSYEKAKNILERAVHESPLDPSRHVLLGQTYAGLGRKDDAIREGKRAIELRPESQDALDGVRMTLGLAQIYAMVGERDMAISLLEHCVASPAGVTANALKLDPAWDSLRNHSRFQKMMAQNSFANTIQKTNIPDRR